jgi:ABC-type transporter Mla subunit MlaD
VGCGHADYRARKQQFPDENVSMSAEIVVGVASAAVSVVGAVAAGLMTTWSAQRTRRYEALIEAQQKAQSKAEQAEAVISRYREPLLAAAQNLHSRLYNMVENDTLRLMQNLDHYC